MLENQDIIVNQQWLTSATSNVGIWKLYFATINQFINLNRDFFISVQGFINKVKMVWKSES